MESLINKINTRMIKKLLKLIVSYLKMVETMLIIKYDLLFHVMYRQLSQNASLLIWLYIRINFPDGSSNPIYLGTNTLC
jgi:hypothetical protein